jgi:hypothetical protein
MRQLVKNQKAACGKTEVNADLSTNNPIKHTLQKMEVDMTQYWRDNSRAREIKCMVLKPLLVTMKPGIG